MITMCCMPFQYYTTVYNSSKPYPWHSWPMEKTLQEFVESTAYFVIDNVIADMYNEMEQKLLKIVEDLKDHITRVSELTVAMKDLAETFDTENQIDDLFIK